MNRFSLDFMQMAQELNLEHHEKLRDRALHYRGNINSFSLVSLSDDTPEIGISNLKSKMQANNALENRIAAKLKAGLGRSTPEKTLQAWIINKALSNNMVLPFERKLTFLTSELALTGVFIESEGKEGKIVNDILAVDDYGALWVIELKSAREKKTLETQINNFISVVDKNRDLFTELVQMLSKKTWSGKICGMVVWPHARTSPLDWGEIEEVCYHHPTYSFTAY